MRPSRTPPLPAFLCATALCMLLTSCRRPAEAGMSLRVGQLQNVHGSLTYLADNLGYIREAGLGYQSVILPAGPDIVNALKVPGADGVDAGGLAATPIVTMIGAGDHPVVLASMLYSTRSIKLVTTSVSGITSDPSTLRGRKIGVVRNTVGDIYLSKLLKKGGLDESNVTVVAGRPADLVNLFAGGHLDAAVLWDPYAVQAVRAKAARDPGTKAIPLIDPAVHPFTMFLVTTQSSLQKKRPALVLLLRALIRAQASADKDPAHAEQILETWMNLQAGDLHDFFADSHFEVKLDAAQTLDVLADELQWLRTKQPSTAVPADLRPYLDSSLLTSVDPSRVH